MFDLELLNHWLAQNAMSFDFQVAEACKQTGLRVEYLEGDTVRFSGESNHPLAETLKSGEFVCKTWKLLQYNKVEENATDSATPENRTSKRSTTARKSVPSESGTSNLGDISGN